MLQFRRQVSRRLDEDHRAHLALLDRLERTALRTRRHEAGDAAVQAVLAEFAQAVQHDAERHFRFEEEWLFTRLEAAGDDAMAALLREEHDTLREVATELRPLLEAAASGPLDEARWSALRQAAHEWGERQVAHVQKETMGLLPMLEDWLDDDTDRELAMALAQD